MHTAGLWVMWFCSMLLVIMSKREKNWFPAGVTAYVEYAGSP